MKHLFLCLLLTLSSCNKQSSCNDMIIEYAGAEIVELVDAEDYSAIEREYSLSYDEQRKTGTIKIVLPSEMHTLDYEMFSFLPVIKQSDPLAIYEMATSIVIPSGITKIDEGTFDGWEALQSITIPESVIEIGVDAFCDCSSLESITIPKSIIEIGEDAFDGCSSLVSIMVDKDNPVFDSRNQCNAIIETGTNTLILGCSNTIIPEGVTSIGNGAFSGSNLTSLIIPEGVTSIGDYAFTSCELTTITIPESVTSIGNKAFSHCTSLTTVTIPKNSKLTSIGNYAFLYCINLTTIIIPESVTSIGDRPFQNCGKLNVATP